MMRSLFSGVSGLKNHQTRMDVIGNNISNVNTAGFKGSRVVFQDMLSQTIQSASSPQGNRGGTNPQQIGLGVGIGSIDTIYSDGNVQSTGKNTDLCISGNGFFIVSDGANKIYSRAGAFEFDQEGNYLIPGSGLKVQGWMADESGNISTNGEVTSIKIPKGQTIPARATDYLTYTKNLSADAKATTTTIPAYTSSTLPPILTDDPLPDGSTKTVEHNADANGVVTVTTTIKAKTKTRNGIEGGPETLETIVEQWSPDTSTPPVYSVTGTKTSQPKKLAQVTAYDSLGTAHLINVTFTKFPGTENAWFISSGKDTMTDPTNPISGGGGTIWFNSNGSFKESNITAISFNPAGADAVSITVDTTAMTQYSGDSTAACTDKTGYAAGSLDSVSIDSTGTMIGAFSNGQNRSLAQVAMATFNNPAGLTKTGNSLYQESNNSGAAQVSTANTGGAGKITASSLEMSNVDLSEEFSNMIITQRGFQANSKIITTSDEMIEILTNLKR